MTDIREPEITEGIGSVEYLWPDFGLEIAAQRLKDEGRAELWFFSKNGTGNRKLLHVTEVNLLATSTMSGLAKRMERHGEYNLWR